MKKIEVRPDSNKVCIESLQVLPTPQIGKEIVIKLLSPFTVYSTHYSQDGKNYYNFLKMNFSRLSGKT